MKVFYSQRDSAETIRSALKAFAPRSNAERLAEVAAILEEVQTRGDEAVLEYTRQWDCPTASTLQVTPDEFAQARARISPKVIEAIHVVIAQVSHFHEAHKRETWWRNDPHGALTGQIIRPIESVGIYVPGGRAAYPSTVLMNTIPARVAGVSKIIICAPPQKDGTLPDAVLVAAQEMGIDAVYKMGGAQAVAAMAYGTETVPAVHKIVGPGNVYVNLAKRLLWGEVGVDLWAGATEVAIIADETAHPDFIAADLLTQLEHGSDSIGSLFTPAEAILQRTLEAIKAQIGNRQRKAIIEESVARSVAVKTENLVEAFEWANETAPEHLTLMTNDAFSQLRFVQNAGCILLGNWTPQAAGDYVAGPSHTLPTGRAARFESPITVDTFLKRSSLIGWNEDTLSRLIDPLTTLAEVEGLDGHAYGAKIRQEQIEEMSE